MATCNVTGKYWLRTSCPPCLTFAAQQETILGDDDRSETFTELKRNWFVIAKTAHAGLGIAEADFNVVVQHLVDTLNKFKVPDAEQKDLLGIIGTLKNDIVENK